MAKKKVSKAKPTGAAKRKPAATKRKVPGKATPKRHTPKAKAPEPRKALEAEETPKVSLASAEPTMVSEDEFDEEIEAIADGTEDSDSEPSDVDEADDEGYF